GLWMGEELKDRIDVHERILKSALFVARELVPGIEVTQSDCYNYGDNHPGEFLDFRQYTFRRLVFADRQAAADARLGIEKQHFTPARAAEAYGNEKRQARDRGVPFELGPDERRRLPESQRSGLADISEGTWSSPIQHGNEWALWLLEGRRLPDLDESPALMAAVREKVRHLFLDAEIARVAERMKKAQDFDRVEILPDGAKQAGAAKAGRR
ncbi:MAG: hypothetical protein KC518_03945, partial [Candidatus Cloacimonetes bacterium]|nr:hypothetical protein [Candidatus Cloacimonadota bacterium]